MKRLFSSFALVTSLCLAIILLILLLNFTNPTSLGSLGVLLVFVNIYLITFLASLLVVRLAVSFHRIIRPPVSKNALRDTKANASRRKATAVVAVLNFMPIFFISMASIAQLSFLSILLLLVFEIIVVFYISRRF